MRHAAFGVAVGQANVSYEFMYRASTANRCLLIEKRAHVHRDTRYIYLACCLTRAYVVRERQQNCAVLLHFFLLASPPAATTVAAQRGEYLIRTLIDKVSFLGSFFVRLSRGHATSRT